MQSVDNNPDPGMGNSQLTDNEALQLADDRDIGRLLQTAAAIRDHAFGNIITYSRKVFIPLTQLCRDVCHYCTFAKTVREVTAPFMSAEQVLAVARSGQQAGCKEALFTLGEKPELRYPQARQALQQLGYRTTLHYKTRRSSRPAFVRARSCTRR